MGFEPTTLRDLVGCSNHWATGDSLVSKGHLWDFDWNRIARLHSQVMTSSTFSLLFSFRVCKSIYRTSLLDPSASADKSYYSTWSISSNPDQCWTKVVTIEDYSSLFARTIRTVHTIHFSRTIGDYSPALFTLFVLFAIRALFAIRHSGFPDIPAVCALPPVHKSTNSKVLNLWKIGQVRYRTGTSLIILTII